MAVKMSTVVFWVVTLYSLVGGYQCFGGMYHLHLQGWTINILPKQWHPPIGLHGITTQKTQMAPMTKDSKLYSSHYISKLWLEQVVVEIRIFFTFSNATSNTYFISFNFTWTHTQSQNILLQKMLVKLFVWYVSRWPHG
jgi:hypothetical protein